MSTQPEHQGTTPARESINDAIRRMMADRGTAFQLEQRLTEYFLGRERAYNELLAACKLMLASHDAACPGESCINSGIDLARAALVKAEGRR